ncbi:hypothetical protein CAFE_03480 [Caprobacter fermentans]|uniref:Uncharacterized protein n=1 Tax=Caproicibacter fermentans TaxID=2576756 RepID=A0A6N8HWA9_9FIRM|nr:hypothetical protein [Caproicibacter fermentans]MVB09683.1 hypothetical protein [Caproicibacter fermentans]
MKTKIRFGATFLALLVSCAMVTTTAFAAETQTSTSSTGKTVYTQTVNAQLEAMPYASADSRTVTANKSLGLALDPGASGWSMPVTFRFSSLPSNAVVRSIAINPGRGVINNNNRNMLGLIVISKIEVTSPRGKTADISWRPYGMTDDVDFLQQQASGNWTALVYGTNITRPTGDRMMDLRSFGSISYKSAQMTVSYVLE